MFESYQIYYRNHDYVIECEINYPIGEGGVAVLADVWKITNDVGREFVPESRFGRIIINLVAKKLSKLTFKLYEDYVEGYLQAYYSEMARKADICEIKKDIADLAYHD